MSKTRWNYIIPFIVIIVLNLCCLKIYGFEVSTTDSGNEIKWKKETVTYLINTTNSPSGSLEALLAAMQTWTEVDTSTFTFVDGGTTSKNSHGEADGINIIDFGVIKEEGVLGQNSFWFYASGEMIDSDIRFNTKNTWSTDTSSDKFDVQNVGTHELGHSLSLEDLYRNSDSGKTMYGYGSPGDTSQRTLHQDDMDGITYLYPVNTSSPNTTPVVSPTPGVATGALAGFVTDNDRGLVIAGATVRNQSGLFTATTGADGYYQIDNIPAGSYTFIALATGYALKTVTGITLTEGETSTLDFALSAAVVPTPSPEECPDASEVVATSASVDQDTLILAKGSSGEVTIIVTDNDGCTAEGVKVTRKLSSANKKMINVKPLSTKTDASGQATFTIRAKKNKGGASVKFSVGGVKDKPKVKIALTK
ncbi:carboxypeptidase regulatory-like domain-containing protein [Candidatus Kuenenia sp.]|uniref:carboxypeptidase regulatory-like domain-containing protein n=1 Tax=Candidatus Kuenenia sp. TaxID=2499824 RepID=UPI00321FC21C